MSLEKGWIMETSLVFYLFGLRRFLSNYYVMTFLCPGRTPLGPLKVPLVFVDLGSAEVIGFDLVLLSTFVIFLTWFVSNWLHFIGISNRNGWRQGFLSDLLSHPWPWPWPRFRFSLIFLKNFAVKVKSIVKKKYLKV